MCHDIKYTDFLIIAEKLTQLINWCVLKVLQHVDVALMDFRIWSGL